MRNPQLPAERRLPEVLTLLGSQGLALCAVLLHLLLQAGAFRLQICDACLQTGPLLRQVVGTQLLFPYFVPLIIGSSNLTSEHHTRVLQSLNQPDVCGPSWQRKLTWG